MFAGWSQWNLGIENEKIKNIKEKTKKSKSRGGRGGRGKNKGKR